MTDEDRDPILDRLFSELDDDLPGEEFTGEVMVQTDRAKRQKIARRIALGALLGLLAIPLEDFALASAHVLAVTLIDLEAGLAAQLLAPVNTVGSLLSVILLGLRIAHKRIFA